MYNVFADFHHASLLNSLIMLFEGRLGGNLYRPIGEEWYKRGFWKIYDHPATVQQFLGIGGATPDGSQSLNDVINEEFTTVENKPPYSGFHFPFYNCHDINSDKTNKAITFDAFMLAPIDIVIASIPQHIEPFKRLCAIHPNHPKLIYQIGNAWNIPNNSVANVMASAIIPNIPPGVNFVSYHQEFDLNIFRPFTKLVSDNGALIWPEKNIYSFVNCFDIQDHFRFDWELFKQIEKQMPDWNFKVYGGQCRDGSIGPASQVAHKMREARFIWHTKAGGDGYGHVIHNIPAVGRPMIVRAMYYQGKMAQGLIKDGETAIVIDNLSNNEIVNKIKYYSDPDRYVKICATAYQNFKKVVDFDREEAQIRIFLANLQ
jgi:hypothetical protein